MILEKYLNGIVNIANWSINHYGILLTFLVVTVINCISKKFLKNAYR